MSVKYNNLLAIVETSCLQKISKFIYAAPALLLLIFGCNSENASDCFQSAGNIENYIFDVPEFDKITVFENIALVLIEGSEIKVEVETGINLRNEVSAAVVNGRLVLRNTNDCNFVRDYGLTTFYVTAPNISEIRSSTGLKISSKGVLNYPNLTLLSESFIEPEAETTDGSFDLNLNAQQVNVVVNGIAYFKLKGNAQNLNITVAAGDTRIEAEEMLVNNVQINHRGSNDMLIQPIISLKGVIRGTGDVISFSKPDLVEVETLYTGQLIFRD